MIRRRARRQDRQTNQHQLGALSDEALMTGVAAREPEAIDVFIDRFQRRVFGAAVAIVRDRALAEEVTQDAFMRVWRRADAYDPRRGSVIGWVMRITRNVAVDALRVRRPEAVDPTQLVGLDRPAPGLPGVAGGAGGPPATSGSPLERGPEATAVRSSQIRDVLAALPDAQSRTLLLSAFYGYTAAEIAELEGVPLGTVKTRIRLGLQKVRDATATTNEELR